MKSLSRKLIEKLVKHMNESVSDLMDFNPNNYRNEGFRKPLREEGFSEYEVNDVISFVNKILDKNIEDSYSYRTYLKSIDNLSDIEREYNFLVIYKDSDSKNIGLIENVGMNKFRINTDSNKLYKLVMHDILNLNKFTFNRAAIKRLIKSGTVTIYIIKTTGRNNSEFRREFYRFLENKYGTPSKVIYNNGDFFKWVIEDFVHPKFLILDIMRSSKAYPSDKDFVFKNLNIRKKDLPTLGLEDFDNKIPVDNRSAINVDFVECSRYGDDGFPSIIIYQVSYKLAKKEAWESGQRNFISKILLLD